jgi:hypothetical protein
LPKSFLAVRRVAVAEAITEMECLIKGSPGRAPRPGEKPRLYRPSDGWPLLPDGRPARRDNETTRAKRKRIAEAKITTYASRQPDNTGGRFWLSFCSLSQLARVKRELHGAGGCVRLRMPDNLQPAGRDYAIVSRNRPAAGVRQQMLPADELVRVLNTVIDSAPLSELRRVCKTQLTVQQVQRIAEAQALHCRTEGRERRGKYSHGHRMLRIAVPTAGQELDLLLALGYVPDDEPLAAEPATVDQPGASDSWQHNFPLRT